ncbi:MAG: hypothetical protein WC919_04175 [Candidatus Paceibacterota bacterium]
MAIRIDIGGVKKLASGGLRDYVRERIVGQSLDECISVACRLAGSVRDGIAERLRRPIADLDLRATKLENTVLQAEPIIKRLTEKGIADGSINEGEARVVDAFVKSASDMVFGE